MNIAIIGEGVVPFRLGKNPRTYREMAAEVVRTAIGKARIEWDAVDLCIDCGPSELSVLQSTPTNILQDHCGFVPKPHLAIQGGGVSASMALHTAVAYIGAGLAEIVLIRGVNLYSHWFTGREKEMKQAQRFLARKQDIEWELPLNDNPLLPFGMIATRYRHEYNVTDRQRALVAVKNRRNAVKNPFASTPMKLSVQEVVEARKVAGDLTAWETSPWPDGAAAIVVAFEDQVVEGSKPVWVERFGSASDTVQLGQRAKENGITGFAATRRAVQIALGHENTSILKDYVQFLEVDDATTISEMIAYEDLGLCERGEAVRLLEDGVTEMEGSHPVNISGGLLGLGNGEGAQGLARIYDICCQLRGEAEKRQLPEPNRALLHEVDGPGIAAAVTIFNNKKPEAPDV